MDGALKAFEDQQQKRPIYVFDLPQEIVDLQDEFIKKSVGLVKLTMRDEMQAMELAKNDPTKASFYMLITALVEVDGKAIGKDGEDERIVNNCDPAIRSLIVDAQNSLSGTTKKTTDDFLKTRRVKVG